MIPGVSRRFDQLVDNGLRRSAIGIAHSHIYNVQSGCACFCLHFVDNGEHIRRKLFDAIKIITGQRHISIV